jgi:RimJ/RimL family protein N-acetyltransferase
MELHRLYFGTHIENVAMQKIGEKLNFQKEGIFRDCIFKNNRYADVVVWGLLI